jgi:uncharacterized protein
MKSKGSRLRRLLAWVRHHPWRATGLALLASVLLLNFVAYHHARAMLTFTGEANRTHPTQTRSPWQKLKVLASGVTIPRPENTRSPQEFGVPFETLHFVSDDGVNLEPVIDLTAVVG